MPVMLRRPTSTHQLWSNDHAEAATTHGRAASPYRSYAAGHAGTADGRAADAWRGHAVACGAGNAEGCYAASVDGADCAVACPARPRPVGTIH
jgi:hypothetical protein